MQRVAASVPQAGQPHVGMFIPTKKPDRAEIPARPTSPRCSRTTRASAAIAAGRGVRSVARQHRQAHQRSNAAGRAEAGAAAQEDARRTVVAQLTLRYGNEKNLIESSGARVTRRQHADARHDQAYAPADSGRARPAQGAARVAAARPATAPSRPRARTCRRCCGSLAEVLREPSFPANEFEQLKQRAAGRHRAAEERAARGRLTALSTATSNPIRRATCAMRGRPTNRSLNQGGDAR